MQVENKSISYVLSKNSSSFFIPPFQRSYAWGRQEIDRYFNDIARIIDSERNPVEHDKREHFFGVLVFKPEAKGLASREVVVDGQQRLTTTLLLLIALRDVEPDDNKKKQIEDMFLKNPTSTYEDKIKLKQVTSDWEAYRALIQNPKNQIPGIVTEGYNRFLSKLEAADYTTDEYIIALSRVNVACILLDERAYKGEDPQIIFETLNSLGKPLSFADLVRNYVLLGMDPDNQTKIFNEVWHPRIESVLKEKCSHFFRDYLQYKKSIYHKVIGDNNTKELYAQFTDYIDKAFNDDKHSFVNDIVRYVNAYYWINEMNLSAIISSDPEVNKAIIGLLRNIFHDIKADAFKAFVMGLLEYHQFGFNSKRLSDDQLVGALTAIRTYLIRRRVLKLTQGENKDIVRLCDKIKGNSNLLVDAKSEIFKLLAEGIYHLRIPNDDDVTFELKRIDFYNGLSKYRKFILGMIEEHMSKVSVDFRDSKITVEHIMPQIPNNAWKQELGDDWERIHKTYQHNIGNLILTEFNSEMGNDSLKLKKKKLSSSNLLYRNDVLNRNTWNQDDIVSHQEEMIERFLAAFPLPEYMRNAENWDTNSKNSVPEVFSPMEDEISEIVTGQAPQTMMVNDELFEDLKSWQDVYLAFLRWLETNKPFVFNMIFAQTEGTFSSPYMHIVTRGILDKTIDETPKLKKRYKRLSDGEIYKNIEEDIEDSIYVFVNRSATQFMQYIRELMIMADMNEESVTIELQESNVPFADALEDEQINLFGD